MKKKEFYLILVNYFVLYIFHFIVIPSIARGVIQWYINIPITVIAAVCCAIFISDEIKYWVIGILFYSVLILIYYPNGAYGMNTSFFGSIYTDYKFVSIFTESFSVFDDWGYYFITIFFLCCQLMLWVVIKILKFIIKKIKSMDNKKF
ncbi:MAG: hypothetical protein LBV08_04815 [Clostridiales bacterium]|nr:hypothetical protein [Clostridiales bacterium]